MEGIGSDGLNTLKYTRLFRILDLGRKENIGLVGGGGKSTLMMALARELRGMGRRVVTTTTTKIWQDQAREAHMVCLTDQDSGWMNTISNGLTQYGHVALGKGFTPDGKIEGVHPECIDQLFKLRTLDCIIVEADGSRGRPLKAHLPEEPLIPASCTKVIALLGADTIGKRMASGMVFRKEQFSSITGIGPDEEIDPERLIRLFSHPSGVFKNAPERAKRVVFLNRMDLGYHRKHIFRFISLLFKIMEKIDIVILGSIINNIYIRFYPQ